MSDTIEIPPRSGTAFVVKKGQAFTVIDPQGTQVSDMVAYAQGDVREVMSNGRTFDYEETIHLTTGNRLWSNRSNVMLEIEEDSLGQHDYLLTPCSEDTFRHFYPDKPVHRGCFGNLAEALDLLTSHHLRYLSHLNLHIVTEALKRVHARLLLLLDLI